LLNFGKIKITGGIRKLNPERCLLGCPRNITNRTNKQQNKQLFDMDEVIISVLLSIALMAYVVFGNIEKSK
jgi:hypothetical protein